MDTDHKRERSHKRNVVEMTRKHILYREFHVNFNVHLSEDEIVKPGVIKQFSMSKTFDGFSGLYSLSL